MMAVISLRRGRQQRKLIQLPYKIYETNYNTTHTYTHTHTDVNINVHTHTDANHLAEMKSPPQDS